MRKITASRPIEHQFEKVAGDVFSRQPVVTVKNESRFNISSANWDVTLLLDGEAASKRTCFDNTTFKSGLDSHSSKPDTVFYADRCSDWNTVEVRRGKTFRFEYALDIRSVEDFSGKRILPVDLPTKAIFEAKIADAKSEIDLANKMKATVQ